MKNFFYIRLAATNIKKNAKFYFPYIITCIGTIMMFYILCFITTSEGIKNIGHYQMLKTILTFGTIVIGLFATLILFYTNSFLIKRRKKEFGLFNILGMEKKHLAKVIAVENIFVALISLILGLLLGLLFSKLMILLLLKLLTFDVVFGFEISIKALIITVVLFCSIFALTLLKNLHQIHLSKPIELLQGSNVGEKEPKTKWLLAFVGFLTLGAGYSIANIVDSPLKAIGLFFIAVLLVIIGTYCLFTAGSIAILKLLRKKKNYYYVAKHFTSVSGMIYRMKQNAVGLANICILSTMVLVILSTTVSLYIGFDDALESIYPYSIEINAQQLTEKTDATITKMVDETILNNSIKISREIYYHYLNYSFMQTGSVFNYEQGNSNLDNSLCVVYFITIDDYNRIHGTSSPLNENKILLYSPNSEYPYETVAINGMTYAVQSKLDTLNIRNYYTEKFSDTFYFIVSDENAIKDIYTTITNGNEPFNGLSYYHAFDIEGNKKEQIALTEKLEKVTSSSDELINSDTFVYFSCREVYRNEFLSIYGGLFFIGIFLGALFIMATVLIMYYKQISEGYDDKKRFEIMQKVGMSKDEIKNTIRSQVVFVFFLPLVTACIHIGAAFKMITKLMAVFGLSDIALFALCTGATIIVFAVFYGIVYSLTAKVYYKIIS